MSHVDFRKWQCRMSLSLILSPMSQVEFKKGLCPMSLYFYPMSPSHVTEPHCDKSSAFTTLANLKICILRLFSMDNL